LDRRILEEVLARVFEREREKERRDEDFEWRLV
jgi:hypothetical protein